jgi:hypothetical protein
MVMVTVTQSDRPAKSTAHTENVLVPVVVGVPLRIPFSPRERPRGGNPTPLPSWK